MAPVQVLRHWVWHVTISKGCLVPNNGVSLLTCAAQELAELMNEEENFVAHGLPMSKVMEINTWFLKGVRLVSCMFSPLLVAEDQEHG